MGLAEYLAGFRDYALNQGQQLEDLLALAKHNHCCLLCVERSPDECHRSVVADLLQQCFSGSTQIVHLGNGPSRT